MTRVQQVSNLRQITPTAYSPTTSGFAAIRALQTQNAGAAPALNQPVTGATPVQPAGNAVAFNPTVPYGPINTQASQAATIGLAGLQEAQAQRESVSQQYAAREQHLSNYLSNLQQQEQSQMSQRQSELQATTNQDLIERGLYNQGTVDAMQRGIGHTFQQSGEFLRERQARDAMTYLRALSGDTTQAREDEVTGRFDNAEKAAEMRRSPITAMLTGTEIESGARNDLRKLGVAESALAGENAYALAKIQQQAQIAAANREIERAELSQKAALEMAGLKQRTDFASADKNQAVLQMMTAPIQLNMGTMSPNRPSWPDIARGAVSGIGGGIPWSDMSYESILGRGYV